MDVGAFEAKTKLSALLDQVEKGEEVTITRRGKPIARLVPIRDDVQRQERIDRAVNRLRELHAEVKGKGITFEEIKEWVEEGRM